MPGMQITSAVMLWYGLSAAIRSATLESVSWDIGSLPLFLAAKNAISFLHSSIILILSSLESCGWKKTSLSGAVPCLFRKYWEHAREKCNLARLIVALITVRVIFTGRNIYFEVAVHFWQAPQACPNVHKLHCGYLYKSWSDKTDLSATIFV